MNKSEKTISLAYQYAKENQIHNIVIATVKGNSARYIIKDQDIRYIFVTSVYEKGGNAMSEEVRRQLHEEGHRVVTAAHSLSGVERGMSNRFGGVYPIEIIAHTLRMFGQGTKVAVEVATMALDAGAIPYGEKIIAIGGSEPGVDTAIVITPGYSADIFSTKIHHIICK